MNDGPISLWTLKEEWGGRPVGKEEFVWAVFKSHDQLLKAMIALSIGTGGGLGGVSISTALESDLEPFMKLRKVEFSTWQYPAIQNIPVITTTTTTPANGSTHTHGNSFRQGDWICTCATHNFMRNSLCIVCGSPRHYHYRRNVPSSLKQLPIILTPSGRALSTGGKVQNISRNPMAPCIIFWPDNEPFPESSQIRPAIHYGSHNTPAPPILNTGNKGPIEQQPGDWVCGKCEYLNWRRRKVCQTCYPYAEGNTDGISPAVQAERLAVLAQVLGTATTTRTIMTTAAVAPQSPSSTTDTTTSIHCSPRSSPSISFLSVPLFSSSPEFKSNIIASSCPESVLPLPSPAFDPPLGLPSYMKDDQNVNVNNCGHPCSPSLPLVPSMPPAVTHGLSTSTRRQSSLTLIPSHDNLSSIWTMSGEELDSTLQFNTYC
ncbi:hypothetical protein Clacol_008230 [Clathrus columnatus]|uniref:RanBP2-type domain-containing protein n=1 Tax=Clathrus columnatus TaxID=1419009 RepID=A0AAV5ALK1_9AGAM|nr:hypothetical protein Clacol_008230 [Clathrus columnatus]